MMDSRRFDELTRYLGLSLDRKRFLTVVAGIVAPISLAGSAATAAAKGKKHKARMNGGVGSQGTTGACGAACGSGVGSCETCYFGLCQNSTCVSSCPLSCSNDDDCAVLSPDCTCGFSNTRCICPDGCSDTCGGPDGTDLNCILTPDCGLHASEERCLTLLCGGLCAFGNVCQDLPGCACDEGLCGTETCNGSCAKDSDCNPNVRGCICESTYGTCAIGLCPGRCNTNTDCIEQGQDDCVCFLGDEVDVAAEVTAEGQPEGICRQCLGKGDACDASTECCGQLLCQANGVCGRKKEPKDHCAKHGQSCNRDGDCCAQGMCYHGKCGEKDSHCNNNGECAQGYSCQGGNLSPGHRRCRRNGRRRSNKQGK